jgi:hypothetical protein
MLSRLAFPAKACVGPGGFGVFADFGERYSAVGYTEERFHCFDARTLSSYEEHHAKRR